MNIKNKFFQIVIIIKILFLGNCSTTITGNFIGTPDFKGYQKISEAPVTGTACLHNFFVFIPIGSRSVGTAFEDAIEASPKGTEGLADAEITWSRFMIPFVRFIYFNSCHTVKGYPAKRI